MLGLMLRTEPGAGPLSKQEIRQRIARRLPSNYDYVLLMRDSLRLDLAQVGSLISIAQRYTVFRDSVYNDLASYLEALHGSYERPEARDRWHGAIEAVTRASVADGPAIRTILSPDQYVNLPVVVRQQLEFTERDLVRLLRGPQLSPP